MTVLLHDALAVFVLGVEFGVPAPIMVMPIPLGTEIPFVQVQEPAGILMMSPLPAVCVGPLMTAFTSDRLQDAAVKVPCAFAKGARKNNKAKKRPAKK